jgi:hypothetical protein
MKVIQTSATVYRHCRPCSSLRHHRVRRCVRALCSPNLDDILELEAPDISDDIHSMQEKIGAKFEVSFCTAGHSMACLARPLQVL